MFHDEGFQDDGRCSVCVYRRRQKLRASSFRSFAIVSIAIAVFLALYSFNILLYVCSFMEYHESKS